MSDSPRHSEDELRRMLATAPVEPAVDVAGVLRRSRARRLPQQLAVGAVGGLAVLGIGFAVVPALLPSGAAGPAVMFEQAPAADGGSPESDAVLRLSAASLQLCGGPLALQQESTAEGLELVLEFPTGVPAGSIAEGTARLSNTGSEAIAGTAAAPTVAVAFDGVVVWHTVEPAAATSLSLEPGQSVVLPVQLHAVDCGDEERLHSGSELPALDPGPYQVSIALDVTVGQQPAVLVSEPLALEVR